MKDTSAIDKERQRRGAELAADMRDAISFPPLPPSPAEVGDLILQTREHVQSLGWGNREQLYTASQVRAAMSECAAMAAARERERGLKELRDAVGEEAHTAADVLRYAKGDEALTSWLGRTLVPAVVEEGSWDHLKLQLEAIAWDQKLNLEDALATVDEFVRDYACPQCRPAPVAPAVPDGYALVPVEPTPEMQGALRANGVVFAETVWREVLAAAPQAAARGE